MARINFISRLLLIENIFGIFRNLSLLNKRLRYYAIAWSVIEIILNLIVLYHTLDYMLSSPLTIEVIFVLTFAFIANIYAVLVILLGYKNVKSFEILYKSINIVYNALKNCADIEKYVQKPKKIGLVLAILFLLNYVAMVSLFISDYVIYRHLNPNIPSNDAWFSFATFCMVCAEIRFFLESISFVVLISILSELLKSLHLTISRFENILLTSTDDSERACEINNARRTFNEWFVIIRHLKTCSVQLRQCFGVQVNWHLNWDLKVFCLFIYYIFQNSI